ncbi:MAG TPA: hypothetical protein VMU42_05845 [Candidatus Sulfotelmatobacter sp.]|nr:hypothetical protein [Candidatus Sulfotelmatobacter sp.]
MSPFLLALAILLSGVLGARAGAPASAGCGPYVNGATVGDTICPARPSDKITIGNGGPWSFGTGTTLLQANGAGFVRAVNARLCADAAYGAIGFTAPPANGVSLFKLYVSYGVVAQTASLCGAASRAYFLNKTGAAGYYTSATACQAARAGDILAFKPAPSGIPFWADSCHIAAAGVTIDNAAGFTNCCAYAPSPPGQASWIIAADNVTLNGGTFEAGAPIKVDDDARNPTIKNVTVTTGSTNSNQTSCILTGNRNGTVTLINDTVHDCANIGGGGQDHNVYISADANRGGPGDAGASFLVDGLNSFDVQNGGWTFKARPLGVARQNRLTRSYIWCRSAGRGCEQNGTVDAPCGGNVLYDHSVFERGPGGDNWYIVKILEEPPGDRLCPARAAVNSFTFDHDYFIWDGRTNGAASPTLVCIYPQDGRGDCGQAGLPAGTTCTISNSVIVSDAANGSVFAGADGLAHSRPCRDGGGNRVYASRAAMAAGEKLPATDVNGLDCGTAWKFPCLPRHM